MDRRYLNYVRNYQILVDNYTISKEVYITCSEIYSKEVVYIYTRKDSNPISKIFRGLFCVDEC